jgi:hypothetical protein
VKKVLVIALFALALSLLNAVSSIAQSYHPLPHGGYVYQAPQAWVVPPYYGYGGYSGPYSGYGSYYRPYYGWSIPPYGFGSPYYNGYNDPNFYSYGPGMREFLQMGGADFYGW